ncbi:MAG: isopentenyl-diphosphate Delta-isomerase [Patescibacteria group bacterium]|jgi:isopentenyl-diphosphate delta-isomerase
MKNLILVDQQDNQIGIKPKLEAHLGKGMLHRAFTAILVNDKKEILLTKRALQKPLWPTFWDGSFSSHPWNGESLEKACGRRVKEELGIEVVGFKDLFSYYYQVRWSSLFSEHEVNHILLTKYNGDLNPDPEEVSDWKWVSWKKVLGWIKKEPQVMAPWWIMAVEKICAVKKMNDQFV